MYKIPICKPEEVCKLNDVKCDKKVVNTTTNKCQENISYVERLTIQIPSKCEKKKVK